MNEFPNKPYYSPDEVAAYLDVTADTIRDLCRRGEIRGARKVGRQYRIPKSYLFGDEASKHTEEKQRNHPTS